MAAYDENAKELLSEKIILAHILSGSVPEFRNVAPEEIQISEVPVFPGGTVSHKVTGLSNEDCTPKYAENTITEFSFMQKNILGNFPLNKVRFDLISVITIYL